uniref:RNA-directed RNA polymerase n=1 Tax=Parastrongyloides trichosuri TaxID=131310 RepID=A0A0N4ZEU5_PARTI
MAALKELPEYTYVELSFLIASNLNNRDNEDQIKEHETIVTLVKESSDIIFEDTEKNGIRFNKHHDISRKDDPLLGTTLNLWLKCDFRINEPKFVKFLNYLKEFLIPMKRVHYAISCLNYFFFKIFFSHYRVENKDIPVSMIGWGNCHYPATFYDHYYVTEKWSRDYTGTNKEFNDLTFNRNTYAAMFVDFYHDRKYFEVHFAVPKCNKDSEIEQYRNTVARVSLFYEKIFKISISKLKYKEDTDEFDTIFNFWTINPITLEISQAYKSKTSEKGARFKFFQARTFMDDNSDFIKSVIHESSIFYLHIKVGSDTFLNLIERFRTLTGKTVEFVNWRKKVINPNSYLEKPFDNDICKMTICEQNSFALAYLIDAVFSRGFVVKDKLLCDFEIRNKFINNVVECYKRNNKVTLRALESLLNKLDESNVIKDVWEMFIWIIKYEEENSLITEAIKKDEKKEGYVYVRKVIVTPTRRILKAPELMMHNRMLRQHDPNGENTIRVLFRSDNGRPIREVRNDFIITDVISDCVDNGMVIGGRLYNFLGSSNSQMREGGCYFYRGTRNSIIELRKSFGSIKQEAIPKMMARIGQCFTQAVMAKDAVVNENKMVRDPDYECVVWKNSKEKVRCFSDGCGMISYSMGENILKTMTKYERVSSCYQFRFRGYKGVLAVYPILDKINEETSFAHIVLEGMGRKNNSKCKFDFPLDCVLRESQSKFKGSNKDVNIEIVKASQPSLLSLNRPLLNVMDQVSKKQSLESNQRICNRVHELFDYHVSLIRKCLLTEEGAFEVLSSMHLKMFGIQKIYNPKIVSFHTEPFFKKMVNSYACYQIQKVLTKLKIPIPSDLGRTMFGVIDETGILEYGQVFIQYSENINSMLMKDSELLKKIIHKGKVMITKNPTVVSGDLRVFEAVDVPELHHIVDVVVFPRDGPRPHSDEMAGSDLDGDEYSIFFDELLFIEYNMPAFDFDAGTSVKKVPKGVEDENDLDDKMKAFIKDFLKTESIGTLASSHLIQSDFFGLDSSVCTSIAIKHNKALDFAKTGEFPELLTIRWDGSKPPETPLVVADFFEYRAAKKPAYESGRLLGELHRRLKLIETILSTSLDKDNDEEEKFNPFIIVNGWEKDIAKAKFFFNRYASMISSLLDTYGIDNESELFSGFRMNLRNRITDSSDDDMSCYGTEIVIQEKLTKIVYKFKCEILETFNKLEYFYPDLPKEECKERIIMVLESPMAEYTDALKRFVCACYHASFDAAKEGIFQFYSFPWIFWDVLKKIAYVNMAGIRRNDRYRQASFENRLSAYIMKYSETRKNMIDDFINNIKSDEKLSLLLDFMKKYKNLDKLLFFLCVWAYRNNLTKVTTCKKFSVLFLEIIYGYYYGNSSEIFHSIDKLSDMTKDELEEVTDLNQFEGGLGHFCMKVLSILSLHKLKENSSIGGAEKNLHYMFMLKRDEWDIIKKKAVETVNNIAFTGSFESLPQIQTVVDLKYRKIISHQPLTIYLPRRSECSHLDLFDKLQKISGLTTIIKRKNSNKKIELKNVDEWFLTPIGTYEACVKFTSLVRPEIPLTISLMTEIDLPLYIATKLYDKIVNLSVLHENL